jgi:predicted protein tyrosine phosphatase
MSMWEWTLNWNDIRGDLIGSSPMTPDNLSTIKKETGVTAMLSLQTDECRAAFDIDNDAMRATGQEIGLVMANAPMRDFDPPDQRRNLANAVRQLTMLLTNGHKVYLHCTAGINRAPLTALGYLSFVEQQNPEEAVTRIRSARAGADPSWEAYNGCRDDLLRLHENHVHVRAYYLGQLRPEYHPDENWFEAEAQTLRGVFTAPNGIYPAPRLDPSRE